ncbi:molybdopterin dinucleotide binding domain-containing protein, partial [Actinomycetospora chlora]|uniref:molybdopterin dinucleotide binding domain-containing protein n=1 Tax=Actinomycetospora chlora TaxID=663608 RepID=UPI0031EF99FF
AVDAGALPTLLPGGRPLDDVDRAQLASSWGLAEGTELPAAPGRDTAAILRAAASGELAGLVVGGVELADLPDPALARRALEAADVVVSLEQTTSEVTRYADVVLPVAPVINKSGTFRNWEGRDRRFATTIDPSGGSAGHVGGRAAITLPDCRVLDTLAVEMDVDLFTQTPEAAAAELARIGIGRPAQVGPVRGPEHPDRPADHHAALLVTEEYLVASPSGVTEVDVSYVVEVPEERDRGLRLATWRQLLDGGALLADEPELAGTARPPKIRLAPATARRLGLAEDDVATIAGPRGELHLAVELTDLPEDVVWAPARVVEPGGPVTLAGLGLTHGGPVRVTSPSHPGSAV